LKLNPHCSFFILLQALKNFHTKKNLPFGFEFGFSGFLGLGLVFGIVGFLSLGLMFGFLGFLSLGLIFGFSGFLG